MDGQSCSGGWDNGAEITKLAEITTFTRTYGYNDITCRRYQPVYYPLEKIPSEVTLQNVATFLERKFG